MGNIVICQKKDRIVILPAVRSTMFVFVLTIPYIIKAYKIVHVQLIKRSKVFRTLDVNTKHTHVINTTHNIVST